MSKLSGLTLFALLNFGLPAHAGNARATPNQSCDHDPKCYARSLALTLTSTQDSLELRHIVDFSPGSVRVYSKSREKIQAIARKWQQRSDWAVISVHGYSSASGRSEAQNVALGQRRADKIRAYFIRYGVPAEYVVAIGHGAEPGGTGVDVNLSIALVASRTTVANPSRFARETSAN